MACAEHLEDSKVLRTTNIYLVTTSVSVKAPDKKTAITRVNAYRKRIDVLATSGAHGARFLNAWSRILEDPEELDFSSIQRESDDSDTWTAQATFEIYASDKSLARTRFLGFRDWLAELQTNGLSASVYSGSPALTDRVAIVLDRIQEEPSAELAWLNKQSEAWFDKSDPGAPTSNDVGEGIAILALDSMMLQTNEQREAVDSLEQAAFHLHRVETDIYAWKWVFISLHNAMQAFMVLALQGTWSIRVLKPSDAQAEIVAAERGEMCDLAKKHDLLNFLALYDRIKQDKFMRMYTNSKAFVPGGTHTRHVKHLNKLRNDFIHFVPKGFSVAIEEFPLMVAACADIIRFLLIESNNITWTSDRSLEDRAAVALKDFRSQAERLSRIYADEAQKFMKPGTSRKFRVKQSNVKRRSTRSTQ